MAEDSEIKKLRERVKKLEREIEKDTETSGQPGSKKISRREFLKKAGLGTAGLAALMSPISALNVKDDNFQVFTSNENGSSLTEALHVDEEANVEITNGNLNLNNHNLEEINNINGTAVSDLGSGVDLTDTELYNTSRINKVESDVTTTGTWYDFSRNEIVVNDGQSNEINLTVSASGADGYASISVEVLKDDGSVVGSDSLEVNPGSGENLSDNTTITLQPGDKFQSVEITDATLSGDGTNQIEYNIITTFRNLVQYTNLQFEKNIDSDIQTVLDRPVLLGAVASSRSAMDAVADSQTAIDTIANSNAGMDSLASSKAAVNAIEDKWGEQSLSGSPAVASVYLVELKGEGGDSGSEDMYDDIVTGDPGNDSEFDGAIAYGGGGGSNSDGSCGGYNVSGDAYEVDGSDCGGQSGQSSASYGDGGDGGYVKALIANPNLESISSNIGGSATIWVPPWA